jgi:hypothetical protein
VRKKLPLIAIAVLATIVAGRAETTVNWFNTSGTAFRDSAGSLLLQGGANTNTDGMLVQLGYFTTSTLSFTGTWVPLTGFGATLHTSIGDADFNTGSAGGGNGNGIIAFSTFFNAGTTNVDVYDGADPGHYVTQSQFAITNTLPAEGTVLAIRFYDATTTAGHYNTVTSSNVNWQWHTPNTPGGGQVTIDLGNSSLLWESVQSFGLTGTEFRTVLPIPEPSSLALLGVGVAAIPLLRRRKA